MSLLASWRSLSCSSSCDALEIIHIIHCGVKSFVCYQVVLWISSRTDRSWARLIEYVLKVLLLSTPKKYFSVPVKRDFIIFSGQVFFVRSMYYKQKWSSRRVVKILCPCATPLGTYFPEGNLVPGIFLLHNSDMCYSTSNIASNYCWMYDSEFRRKARLFTHTGRSSTLWSFFFSFRSAYVLRVRYDSLLFLPLGHSPPFLLPIAVIQKHQLFQAGLRLTWTFTEARHVESVRC